MHFTSSWPSRSMHPLARVALLLVGAAVACVLLVLGALALAILLGVGVVALLVRQFRQPHSTGDRGADTRVLEGTCVVLDKQPHH